MTDNEIGIEAARKTLGEIVDRAHHDGETTYLTRHGKRVAAVIPVTMKTWTDREQQLITTSGRTLASDERGATSGRLLRSEFKPQPGDIRPCPVSRKLLALVLRSGTMGPFERGDGSGMEPGMHYWFEYAMVEPIHSMATIASQNRAEDQMLDEVAEFVDRASYDD